MTLGVWLHAADSLVVATLLPSIVEELGGVDLVAWTFALYEVGSIIAGAGGVYFVYKSGLKPSMAIAAAIYMAGCIFSAMASSMETMLLGRFVQGFGGGGLVAFSFIAIRQLFPREYLAPVVAAISGLWGTSAFFGPLIGGIFAEFDFWRGAFWFFALQAAGLAIWISVTRKQSDAETNAQPPQRNFPALRLTLIGLGVVAIASGGIDVTAIKTSLSVAIGILFLMGFAYFDKRAGDGRLFPVAPFDPRGGLGAPLFMVMSFAMATISLSIFGPLIMTTIHGLSALYAGYIIALSSIGWSLAAVISASADKKHDPYLIMSGMVVLTLSIFGFMIVMPTGPIWLICLFALTEGAGFGMAWTFIMRRAEDIAATSERDRLAAALPTIHRLGYALGAAIMGIVANAAGFSEGITPQSAQSAAFWIFAASLPFAAIGLFAAWRFVRQ